MRQEGFSCWVMWGLGAIGALFVLRVFLLAWSYQHVSLEQMKQIHGWMVSHPDVGTAASAWMAPGVEIYQGDYRALRRAVNQARHRQGMKPLARQLAKSMEESLPDGAASKPSSRLQIGARPVGRRWMKGA